MSVLVRPRENSPLILYLTVSNKAINSVLVWDDAEVEKPVYSVRKVLKRAETRKQKIERLALAIMENSQKLRHYFQSHAIIFNTNYPNKKILKESDLTGRIVSWAVELSEYDIMFTGRSNIKSQVLEDFLIGFSSPSVEELS